jgi:hypothetical protein
MCHEREHLFGHSDQQRRRRDGKGSDVPEWEPKFVRFRVRSRCTGRQNRHGLCAHKWNNRSLERPSIKQLVRCCQAWEFEDDTCAALVSPLVCNH